MTTQKEKHLDFLWNYSLFIEIPIINVILKDYPDIILKFNIIN